MAGVEGLVLAAGAGSRFGGPKALARDADGRPWLELAAATLAEAGCTSVTVVLGAEADAAAVLTPSGVAVVVASDWASGMSASLAAGIAALGPATAALITLVDLPGLPVSACRRVLGSSLDESTLRRATYGGRPGHPVLVGRAHWSPLRESLAGDAGGRAYLAAAGVDAVECGDLFSGRDIDRR